MKEDLLNKLNIKEIDYNKALSEFGDAWDVACRYCEKRAGIPTFDCKQCPLMNTADNFVQLGMEVRA